MSSVSTKEGWGGKKITELPMYKFFDTYINVNKEKAFKDMYDYYFEETITSGKIFITKKNGGLKGGTLYHKIHNEHKKRGIILDKNLTNLNIDIVEYIIKLRVKCRLNMIESIKLNGYNPSYDFVQVVKKDNYFYITAGHHRTATMHLLGYKKIYVSIDNPYFLRKIHRVLRIFHQKNLTKPC